MLYDVIIVGGGLAGLTAAIELSDANYSVVVVEMNHYPAHKVCGEYVSNEVVPYLESLGIYLEDAVNIDRLIMSRQSGRNFELTLPLGGIGISRYALDNRLYKKALANGVKFIFDKATDLRFDSHIFNVITDKNHSIQAKVAIGAHGKRSSIDKALNRSFFNKNSPWLAVKMHYHHSSFPENLVALHSFNGGYGGLSRTESDTVNFCYLASYQSFSKYKNINEFNEKIISQNPYLKQFFSEARAVFEKPMSIAQISFERKKIVDNNVLMCGDAAGLIHPLCGNGMAMAIHSGKMVSEHVRMFLRSDSIDRKSLEKAYLESWQKAFERRLWWGRRLQSVLLNPISSSLFLEIAALSKVITRSVIRQTHGTILKA